LLKAQSDGKLLVEGKTWTGFANSEEQHVPEDPRVSPLFANMSPDHPERVAAWPSDVFGGPNFYAERYGATRL
jgi:hypothetical protein